MPQKLGKGGASFPVVHTAEKGWFNSLTRRPFIGLDWLFQEGLEGSRHQITGSGRANGRGVVKRRQ